MIETHEILVVDDDILVRNALKRSLEVLEGVKVWDYESSPDALAFVRVYPRIKLVLTDHRMPVMNGVEFARKVRAYNAAVPIICVTGFAEVLYDHELFVEIIEKPFAVDVILESVRRVLGLPQI